MRQILDSDQVTAAQKKVLAWLTCGITPRQLAFTLALGFAIGCIPLLGVTTCICAAVALLLRLNMPVIQAANWLAMPLQMLLLYPFLRFGQWLLPGHSASLISLDRTQIMSQLTAAPWDLMRQLGTMFGMALVAWVVAAGPALVLLTVLLTPLMSRASQILGEQQN